MSHSLSAADIIENRLKTSTDPERALIDVVSSGEVGPEDIFAPAFDQFQRNPAFSALLTCAETRDGAHLSELIASGAIYHALSSDLSRFLIANYLIPRREIEFILTGARRALLFELTQTDDQDIGREKHIFLCALAQQCFLNEYVFWESPDETLWVDLLRDSLEIVSESGEGLQPHLVALYACYRAPLSAKISEASILDLEQRADSYFAPFLSRTIRDPLAERRLAPQFESLTGVKDHVSQLVRQQYEENPYPRWFITGRVPAAPADAVLKTFGGIDLNLFGTVERPRILVAGCGTGSNILHFAGAFANAEITAIDLSRASLAYAKLHCDRFGMAVRYAQADILELAQTGLRFDIIECSGVLHHMKDPLAGAAALVKCLRPGGVIRIGLYSRVGRDVLSPARLFIQRGQYPSTPDGIRRFRRDLVAELARDQKMKFGLSHVTLFSDFYSLSMCRDLVFHVQERDYTIPQIQEFTDQLGLRLASFHFQGQRELVTWDSNYTNRAPVEEMARLEREGQLGSSLHVFIAQKPA